MICPGPDWTVAAACFLWGEVGSACVGASRISGEKGGFLP